MNLEWRVATAYDLFISLKTIYNPERYEIRPSWAAGIRSRLPSEEAAFLGRFVQMWWISVPWLAGLPEPQNGTAVLTHLRRIPVGERLTTLMDGRGLPVAMLDVLFGVMERGSWQEADLAQLKAIDDVFKPQYPPNEDVMRVWLDFWAEPVAFGEMVLPALESFYNEFYVEEEQRIEPYLQAAVARGQALAADLALPELLEELSQGIRYEVAERVNEILFVPSFWATPLILDADLGERLLFMYGAKPDDVSFVPGELVPHDLPQALKALSDPTRLRILRLLSERPYAPGELAQELRLRPPTVTHHLQTLRMARLVHLTLSAEDRRVYALRAVGIDRAWRQLYGFVQLPQPEAASEMGTGEA